jgi:hypothetical protein
MPKQDFIGNFKTYSKYQYIDHAFNWEYSPEGHYFWENIHITWIKYLRTKNENFNWLDEGDVGLSR